MNDLAALTGMLDRCGIQHSDSTSKGVTSVEFSPDDPNWDDDPKYARKSPNLTGDSWAAIEFKFAEDGRLLGIDMQGD
jgi:hypothetical protein